MATQTELAIRVLQNLKVLGTGQSASVEDLQIAEQKIRAVHATLKSDQRVRWTIQSIPVEAEEPYVFMASFLAAPAFGQGLGEAVWNWGQREINRVVNTSDETETTRTEYF